MIRCAWAVGLICWLSTPAIAAETGKAALPNIVWIMADDLGYGDVGCYGQLRIKTPNIDCLASQGMRFTDCYAGSTVCAPSRCSLMTGLHTGHARVRGNARVPLEPDDVTIAEVLKQAGYATGIVGKWGLGEPDTTGVPNRQGFDNWFGYLNQHHAHNYYPDHLWRNEEKVPLPNVVENNVATKRVVYSADLFTDEALRFLDTERDRPFFLYLALTLPHANNEAGQQGMEVPRDEPYSHESWPQAQKNHAAMITYLDTQVGAVLKKLDERGLAKDTVVFFTSDNGPHREGGADPDFFDSSGPFRGIKRALYEGGIRVPMIVRWPGKIAAGSVNHQPWAFWDALPTMAELAGVTPPQGIDGISIVPTLLGEAVAGLPQQQHEFLYWEFHERGFGQAVRMGNWKAVRPKAGEPIELYDLSRDIGEEHDVAAELPKLVANAEALFKSARTESPHWQVAGSE
ncbi:MAG: arylsulfatase [Pirellulales bacterium]